MEMGALAIIGLIGTAVQVAGQMAAAKAQAAQANYNAKIQEQQALLQERKGRDEFGAAQRAAMEKRREADIVASRGIALAAASGGGGYGNATIDYNLSDIIGRGDYNSRSKVFEGGAAKDYAYGAGAISRSYANLSRMEGKAAKTGGMYSAIGTGLSGLGGFAKSLYG
jgi:hypothetical protein